MLEVVPLHAGLTWSATAIRGCPAHKAYSKIASMDYFEGREQLMQMWRERFRMDWAPINTTYAPHSNVIDAESDNRILHNLY